MNQEKEQEILQDLLKKLQSEIDYKEKCDTGRLIETDDWGDEYIASYSPSKWQDKIKDILEKTGGEIEAIESVLEQFKEHIKGETTEEYISQRFINELTRNVKRITLENTVMRDDIVEYVSKLSKEEIEEIFGSKIARMKGFDQKNMHHCYDLLGHTLHTIEGISPEGLTQEQYKKLRISALFHDVGKPDVAQINEKTGQQVFYGHAQKSMEIAEEILEDLGYDYRDIEEMKFFIGHHDDFISYKSKLAPWMKNHEFIREITPETVAEKMIENEYDFEAMGYDKDQIRYICYALAHEQTPQFYMQKKPVQIDVDMDQVHRKIQEVSRYNIKPKYTLEQYKMLLNLCRADANAQSKEIVQNGKKVNARAEKIENMNNIDKSSDKAMEIFEKVHMSSMIIGQIAKEAKDEFNFDFANEDPYYEGYQDPIRELKFHHRFDNKSPEFIKDLKAKILENAPKQYESDVEGYEEEFLEDEYEEERTFNDYYEEHLAEAFVELDDIADQKEHTKTPLEEREEKLSSLEKEQRIMDEMEKIIANRENQHTEEMK